MVASATGCIGVQPEECRCLNAWMGGKTVGVAGERRPFVHVSAEMCREQAGRRDVFSVVVLRSLIEPVRRMVREQEGGMVALEPGRRVFATGGQLPRVERELALVTPSGELQKCRIQPHNGKTTVALRNGVGSISRQGPPRYIDGDGGLAGCLTAKPGVVPRGKRCESQLDKLPVGSAILLS